MPKLAVALIVLLAVGVRANAQSEVEVQNVPLPVMGEIEIENVPLPVTGEVLIQNAQVPVIGEVLVQNAPLPVFGDVRVQNQVTIANDVSNPIVVEMVGNASNRAFSRTDTMAPGDSFDIVPPSGHNVLLTDVYLEHLLGDGSRVNFAEFHLGDVTGSQTFLTEVDANGHKVLNFSTGVLFGVENPLGGVAALARVGVSATGPGTVFVAVSGVFVPR